jgi:hypothetical protein
MSAYLFTGWTSHFKAGQFGNSCLSLITYGSSLESANAHFAQWLLASHQHEDPVPAKIEQVVVAPVLEQLLTEEGPFPIDWVQVCEEAARTSDADAEEVFEQGHWADCDALVRPDNLSPDINSLREALPDDISSGLNWSGEKQYIFLVSVLSQPQPPAESEDLEDPDLAEEDPDGQEGEDLTAFRLNDRAVAFPELAAKDAAFVVRARNSTVAAWLYRKHTAATLLARNRIRVGHWCGAEQISEHSPTLGHPTEQP